MYAMPSPQPQMSLQRLKTYSRQSPKPQKLPHSMLVYIFVLFWGLSPLHSSAAPPAALRTARRTGAQGCPSLGFDGWVGFL